MSVELPNDVWFYIVKDCIDAEKRMSDLKNLALTNKLIREITVPMLYEKLVFLPTVQSDQAESGDSYPPMHVIHRRRYRARSLLNSPHLLYHVRRFEIGGWSSVIGTREEMFESGKYTRKSEWEEIHYQQVDVITELWSALYNIVTSLILQMPRLKWLDIWESPITLQLHSIFYRIPALETLEMGKCKVPEAQMSWGTWLFDSYPLHIKELLYSNWHDAVSVPYFQLLLNNCLPYLTKMTTNGVDISYISNVARNGRFPLRSLEMSFFTPFGDDPQQTAALLKACPELREIRLKDGADMDLDLGEGSLPNLEFASASQKVVRQLVHGRPVRRVEIIDSAYVVNPEEFEAPWSPSVPITRVHLEHCLANCSDEEDVLKSMVCAFPHVTHLTFDTTFMDMCYEDINEMMVANIAQWPALIHCRLYDKCVPEDEMIEDELEFAECPIAPRCDPNKRGHPTLVEVRLMSPFTWIWDPEEGWLPEIRYWAHEDEKALASNWDPVTTDLA